MDSLFPTKQRSPNIDYQFIEDVLAGYENLQRSYSGTERIPGHENSGWRYDFRFLFELCEGYNFYQMEKKWTLFNWQKLPSLYSARWNSPAIYASIAYVLLPKWRNQLKATCDFIAVAWAKTWFSNQHYLEETYN